MARNQDHDIREARLALLPFWPEMLNLNLETSQAEVKANNAAYDAAFAREVRHGQG